MVISKEEKTKFNAFKKEKNLDSKYVIIHPGAKNKLKPLNTYDFAKVADGLYEMGYRIIITGTINQDATAQEMQDFMKYRPINLCGKINLEFLALLINNASLLISNAKTYPLNIAITSKIPSISISKDSKISQMSCLNHVLHKSINSHKARDYENILKEAKKLLLLETPRIYTDLERNMYEISYKSLSYLKMLRN